MAGVTRTPATSAATASRSSACMTSPSEVVRDAETGEARRRIADHLFVTVVHGVGAAGHRVLLRRTLLVQQIEHRHREGQLAVGPHRTVFDVRIAQLFPRLAALVTRTRRLAEAEVVVAAVAGRIALLRSEAAEAGLRQSGLDEDIGRNPPLGRAL